MNGWMDALTLFFSSPLSLSLSFFSFPFVLLVVVQWPRRTFFSVRPRKLTKKSSRRMNEWMNELFHSLFSFLFILALFSPRCFFFSVTRCLTFFSAHIDWLKSESNTELEERKSSSRRRKRNASATSWIKQTASLKFRRSSSQWVNACRAEGRKEKRLEQKKNEWTKQTASTKYKTNGSAGRRAEGGGRTRTTRRVRRTQKEADQVHHHLLTANFRTLATLEAIMLEEQGIDRWEMWGMTVYWLVVLFL